MTNEMLSDFVYHQLKEIFEDNSEEIGRHLINAAAPEPLDEKTVKLLSTAMFMASQSSVLYMLHFLNNNGVISLPDDNQPFLWTRDRTFSEPPVPPEPSDQE